MFKKALPAALSLALLIGGFAYAQNYSRLIGGDQSQSPPVPATNTNPVPITTGGVAQASITNLSASIPNASTAVTLVAASRHIRIVNNSAATILYVDLANGTATTGDTTVGPGKELSYDGGAAITTFKIIGSAAADTYSVTAW